MRILKVLHIASFSGNIGDNLNHHGFFEQLEKNTGWIFDCTKIEMRDFYFNSKKRKFDLDFIEGANLYDLIIIGGGNYFEIAFEESQTGCTIDINPNLLDKFTTPLLINGVGFDTSRGISNLTKERFEIFLEKLLLNKNCYVTLRNDGSLEDLIRTYGRKFSNMNIVSDGGFFLKKIKKKDLCFKLHNLNYIAINLAGDIFDRRFNIDEEKFNEFMNNLSVFLNSFIQKTNNKIVFTSHVLSDYNCTMMLLSKMDSNLVRNNVIIAPFFQSELYMNTFKIYENAKIVLSNRFHANVSSISYKTPVIGIFGYPKDKIPRLHKELNIKESTVDIYSPDFLNELDKCVNYSLSNMNKIKKEYSLIVKRMKKNNIDEHKKIVLWLSGINK